METPDKAEQIIDRLSKEDAEAVAPKDATVESASGKEGNGFKNVPFNRELMLFFLISTLAWGALSATMLISMRAYTEGVKTTMDMQSTRFEKMMDDLEKKFNSVPVVAPEKVTMGAPIELKEGAR